MRPLFGWGPGSFPHVFYENASLEIPLIKYQHTHNLLIELAYNFGLPTASLIIVTVFSLFIKAFRNRIKSVKNILLDQKIVSGIGNIYASEILFSSRINPLILGKKLKLYQIKNLYKYSKIVLKNAILKGGSSIRDFKNIVGQEGLFQKEFKVYDRQNETCNNKKCNYKIKKILISNRSTFYCKNCQK